MEPVTYDSGQCSEEGLVSESAPLSELDQQGPEELARDQGLAIGKDKEGQSRGDGLQDEGGEHSTKETGSPEAKYCSGTQGAKWWSKSIEARFKRRIARKTAQFFSSGSYSSCSLLFSWIFSIGSRTRRLHKPPGRGP